MTCFCGGRVVMNEIIDIRERVTGGFWGGGVSGGASKNNSTHNKGNYKEI